MAPVPSTEARGPLCPHLRYAWKRAVVDTRAPHPAKTGPQPSSPCPGFVLCPEGQSWGWKVGVGPSAQGMTSTS